MTYVIPNYMTARPQQGRYKAVSNILTPKIAEIIAVATLLLFYFAADTVFGDSSYNSVNYIGPLVLVIILGYANWLMIKRDGKNVWTALFWFRLSTLVYFGLGTIFVYHLNDATLTYIQVFYKFNEHEVFKLNLIVSLSVLLVLVMARMVLTSGKKTNSGTFKKRKNAENSLLLAAILFLGTGLLVNYLLVVPYRMGWSEFILPGSIAQIKKLTPIGVFLMTLWGLRNARWALPYVFGLVAVEMLLNLLTFSKADFLLLIIMVSLAFLWNRVTLKKIVIIGLIVSTAYFTIMPMVTHARYEIGLRYGLNTQAGFGERLEILGSYFTSERRNSDVKQGGLSRLSYVNAATFTIYLYDSGRPNNWPELIPAVFIPRLFWKDKPIITGIGIDLYELSTGRRTSSSGAGLFAQSYWAWGWWGVLIFMSAYGIAIGYLTRFSYNVMQEGNWLYFPIVLMGLRYGMRTDGHYISDAIGGLVILVAFYFIIRILKASLRFQS